LAATNKRRPRIEDLMAYLQNALRGIGALLIAMSMATAVRADATQAGNAATQSAIRDIRDRVWQQVRVASAQKEQVPPAPREPRRK
jgi:hypothetical protein